MPTDVNSGGIENRLTEVVYVAPFLCLFHSLSTRFIAVSISTFCRSRIKNLHMFLLCVQWFSPFAILLLKIVVEFASFDLGVVLRMHATVSLCSFGFTFEVLTFLCVVVLGLIYSENRPHHIWLDWRNWPFPCLLFLRYHIICFKSSLKCVMHSICDDSVFKMVSTWFFFLFQSHVLFSQL